MFGRLFHAMQNILTDKLRAVLIFASMKRLESKNSDEIARYQERKLKQILKSAATNPFYRAQFLRCGANPNSAFIDDLEKLPILSKEIYREQIATHAKEKNKKLWTLYTSGSTGFRLGIPLSRREGIISKVLFRYACFKSGLRVTDSLCYLTVEPEQLLQSTLIQKAGFGRHINLDLRCSMEHNVQRLITLKPEVLCSFPSYLSLMARYLVKHRVRVDSVRLILTGGEVLMPETRELMQKAFTAIVRDHYGCREFSWLAYECGHGRMHVIPYAVIIEVVNPDSNGIGDALVTSLYHQAAPFIRYRIGDRLKLTDTKCACGVRSQIIETIEGRCNDFFVLPSGKRISWRSLVCFPDIKGLLEYQLIQKRPDYFEVHVKNNEAFTDREKQQMIDIIKKGCYGENISVRVITVNALQRGRTGKLQAVISEVSRI